MTIMKEQNDTLIRWNTIILILFFRVKCGPTMKARTVLTMVY